VPCDLRACASTSEPVIVAMALSFPPL